MDIYRARLLRLFWGQTQDEVAAATGVSQSVLSAVERGMRPSDPRILTALAAHYGLPATSADSLLTKVPPPPEVADAPPSLAERIRQSR